MLKWRQETNAPVPKQPNPRYDPNAPWPKKKKRK
jgi:hypothetical protein